MPNISQRRLFQNAFMTVTGTLNQHVNRAELPLNLVCQRGDRRKVRDIQNAANTAARLQRLERLFGLLIAYGADNAVTGFQGLLGQCATKSAADAGNKE